MKIPVHDHDTKIPRYQNTKIPKIWQLPTYQDTRYQRYQDTRYQIKDTKDTKDTKIPRCQRYQRYQRYEDTKDIKIPDTKDTKIPKIPRYQDTWILQRKPLVSRGFFVDWKGQWTWNVCLPQKRVEIKKDTFISPIEAAASPISPPLR